MYVPTELQLSAFLTVFQNLGKSPMIKYVQGVISGQYKGDDLFGSLLQAMVLKSDKDNRALGCRISNMHLTLLSVPISCSLTAQKPTHSFKNI